MEDCGVFGTYSEKEDNVFPYIYWGIRAQNHRGHQSHGFLTFDGSRFTEPERGLDVVPKLKQKDIDEWVSKLQGNIGIASVRYATFGGSDEKALLEGAQPVLSTKRQFGSVFNGGLIVDNKLKGKIRGENPSFEAPNCDLVYIIENLEMEHSKSNDIVSSVKNCMEEIDGAYSVACIGNKGEFFAFRDPHGIRPLCIGRDNSRGLYAVSSETIGLDINGIPFEKDFEVKPGEIIFFNKGGIEREQVVCPKQRAFCAFEFAYFARPDSKFGDKYVYDVREEFGRNLIYENPDIVKNSDIIVSVPETSDDAAYGAHEASGLRWERCSRRHRYVTERAFMTLKGERQGTIDKKINIIPEKVNGKRILIKEDSIVRGDTTKVIIEKLRKDGAKKAYVFSTFPQIRGPCFYGIDMSTYGQLIGSRKNEEEIADAIGADAVRYQKISVFVRATGFRQDELCMACVTGKYPTPEAQRLADKSRKDFENRTETDGRLVENQG